MIHPFEKPRELPLWKRKLDDENYESVIEHLRSGKLPAGVDKQFVEHP